MPAYEKYSRAIFRHAQIVFSTLETTDGAQLKEVLKNHLFGFSGATSISRTPTPKERLFKPILRGFIEIQTSFERLEDLEIYIARFPFARTRVTKARYLAHVVEAHLNEVYVLRERLLAYSRRVRRSVRQYVGSDRFAERFTVIEQTVSNALSDVTRARGAHIHARRYQDDDLDRLSSLELMLDAGAPPSFRRFYEFEYKHTRRNWVQIVRKNNQEIRNLVNLYFEDLYDLVFGSKVDFLTNPCPQRGQQ